MGENSMDLRHAIARQLVRWSAREKVKIVLISKLKFEKKNLIKHKIYAHNTSYYFLSNKLISSYITRTSDPPKPLSIFDSPPL